MREAASEKNQPPGPQKRNFPFLINYVTGERRYHILNYELALSCFSQSTYLLD
jgi:hypothetical protein